MRTLTFIILMLSLSGCNNFQRGVGEVGAVGGGAIIGRAVTKSTVGTVAGAAGGLLLAKVAETQVNEKLDEKYKEGYNDGRMQVSQQTYLALQNAHAKQSQTNRKSKMLEVVIPEQHIDGQIINARKELIRVE